MTSQPKVRLGTKWPSMTSHWIRSTPAFSRAATSSPNREKSAGSTEGTIFGVMARRYRPASRVGPYGEGKPAVVGCWVRRGRRGPREPGLLREAGCGSGWRSNLPWRTTSSNNVHRRNVGAVVTPVADARSFRRSAASSAGIPRNARTPRSPHHPHRPHGMRRQTPDPSRFIAPLLFARDQRAGASPPGNESSR
jgi:hypothetical protein